MKRITSLFVEDEKYLQETLLKLQRFMFDFTNGNKFNVTTQRSKLIALLSSLITQIQVHNVTNVFYGANSFTNCINSIFNTPNCYSGALFIPYSSLSGYTLIFDLQNGYFEIRSGQIEKSIKPDVPDNSREKYVQLEQLITCYEFGYSGMSIKDYLTSYIRKLKDGLL